MLNILLPVLIILSVATADVFPQTQIKCYDGNVKHILAFGTFGRTFYVDEVITPAVIQAIKSGYRQIDTADVYQNERRVGEAIAEMIERGIVTRKELFIVTKVSLDVGTREGVLPAVKASLKTLGLDYLDLLLIHMPYNLMSIPVFDYISIWKGMEDAKKCNLVRSIGVSNFEIYHLKELFERTEIKPSVNQIEVHPSYTNIELVKYCQSLNITVQSYAPFGWMVPRPFVHNPTTITFEEPVLVKIAKKYRKTTSQVAVRYLIDRGTVPIPRSTNMEHIKSNIDVNDFSLTPKEVESINKLNKDAKIYRLDDPSAARDITEYFGLS